MLGSVMAYDRRRSVVDWTAIIVLIGCGLAVMASLGEKVYSLIF